MITTMDFRRFVYAYIEAAEFAAYDVTGEHAGVDLRGEDYSLSFGDLRAIVRDCREFFREALAPMPRSDGLPHSSALRQAWHAMGRVPWACVVESAGSDFFFTRNGHGCGFWDGDWPDPWGGRLAKMAMAYGEQSLYARRSGDAWEVDLL